MRKFITSLLVVAALVAISGLSAQGKRVKLFDGATLKGWHGNPAFWSVMDGAIHGATDKTPGELILTDGDYADFRLILKSRLVSESNHLGVCFWGERRTDRRYGECVLVIPPNHGMWDYRPGKGSPPRDILPHTRTSKSKSIPKKTD